MPGLCGPTLPVPSSYSSLSVNIAPGKSTTQSSTSGGYFASRAVDLSTGTCSITTYEVSPWWRVDLGTQYTIGTVKITNSANNWHHLSTFDVKVGISGSSYAL